MRSYKYLGVYGDWSDRLSNASLLAVKNIDIFEL